MFHTVVGPATRFLINGEKYYIYIVDNSLVFLTGNNFPNRLTVDEVITISSTPRFLKDDAPHHSTTFFLNAVYCFLVLFRSTEPP